MVMDIVIINAVPLKRRVVVASAFSVNNVKMLGAVYAVER